MATSGWISRALVIVVIVLGSLGVAHAFAPAARAECDGGYLFDYAVANAQAAIVGRVATISRHTNGFIDVTGVRVERAYGTSPGAFYSGRATTAWCADRVRVGSRVVVLVGVTFPEVAGRGDIYYVVTQSVTEAQAARIGLDLPATDTVAMTLPTPAMPLSPPWALIIAGSLGFALALWRRARLTRWRPA